MTGMEFMKNNDVMIMRAYSDVYLDDVVENQGKLFDFVAQTFPDKDTKDFINTYMASKTRKSIDEAKAYVNTMDSKMNCGDIFRRMKNMY